MARTPSLGSNSTTPPHPLIPGMKVIQEARAGDAGRSRPVLKQRLPGLSELFCRDLALLSPSSTPYAITSSCLVCLYLQHAGYSPLQLDDLTIHSPTLDSPTS